MYNPVSSSRKTDLFILGEYPILEWIEFIPAKSIAMVAVNWPKIHSFGITTKSLQTRLSII